MAKDKSAKPMMISQKVMPSQGSNAVYHVGLLSMPMM